MADLDVLTERVDALIARIDRHEHYTEKALALATESLTHRLAGMNEFRQQMSDERGNYLFKAEYHASHDPLVKDVQDLKESRANLAGKASQQSVSFAHALAVAGIALSLLSMAIAFMK